MMMRFKKRITYPFSREKVVAGKTVSKSHKK
jgi:hypothetical protein